MSKYTKFICSLVLINIGVIVSAAFICKKNGGYSWSTGNGLEWLLVSRDWPSIFLVSFITGILSLSIYLMLDSFGKIPGKV